MLKRRIDGWLDAYVSFAERFSPWILLAAAVLSVVCGTVAGRVNVNPRIEALLPSDTDSARAVLELKERLQSDSPLYFLVQSDDLDKSRRLARRLHAEVSAWPETRWAMYKRDPSVFSDKRLLYLSAEDIEELDEQIDERERWESCEKIPGCANLDDEPPPLPTDKDLQALFDKDPDVRALVSLFGKDSQAFVEAEPESAPLQAGETAAAGTQRAVDDRASAGASDAAGDDTLGAGGTPELGELCDAHNKVCSVQIQIDGDPSDVEFATSILDRSEALFQRVKSETGDTEVRMAVNGRYRNVPVTKRMVNRDLTKISIISAALVLMVMLFQFRGVWSLVVLFVPASLGIWWTLGGIALLHPQINLISAFTLAVLAGVGIDFGVHLLTHYAEARELGEAPKLAIAGTLKSLYPSLSVAAFTTSSGFGALGATSFEGFAEMGPIAAIGILVSLLAFLIVFPALVLTIDKQGRHRFGLRRYSASFPRLRGNKAMLVAFGTIAFAVGMGFVGRGVEFEYNFKKLRATGVAHGIPWVSTLHGTSRTEVYMLADDPEALRRAAAGIRQEHPAELVNPGDSFIVIPSAFIPPDQPKRLEALQGLAETLERAKRNASDELRDKIERFEPLAKVREPITLERLPRWVSEWLVERDGSFGTLGVLYANLTGSNAKHMEVLVRHMRAWRERYPDVRFASSVAQLGEVTPRLRNEAPRMLGLALLGVCLGTLVIGRSLRRLLLVLLPLMVMTAISVGLMSLCGLRTNLYNMLVFPLAFGIGVDGAVYVTWALGSKNADTGLAVAARAVLGSTLTSMAGFGSLMISNNAGLASIGWLAMLMLGASLLANLVWLPALHEVFAARSRAGGQRASGRNEPDFRD